nr:hypothetical protein GCM10020093_055730 [Planobispora longispora]
MSIDVKAARRSPAEPAAYRWRWAALFVILAAEVMDLLDAMITNIAAPPSAPTSAAPPPPSSGSAPPTRSRWPWV